MLKDNQLSTVLLLVALGFLIYYLTKPKTVSEGFAEADVNAAVGQKQSDLPEIKQEPAAKAESSGKLNTPDTVSEVQPEVLRQILAEADTAPVSTTVTEPEKSMFDFEANDVYETGAELDAAFERPIPQQARPDEVPINKNNLKNYDAKDFLPKEINSQWFDTDFSQAKYNVNDDKLINTERYVIGVNTVGQSLKNASYDIRGTIANPKFTVSPWNNSTYEPDYNIKGFC